MREGQQEITDAQRDAQKYTAAKPVTPDDAAEARNDVANARQDAAANVADAKNKERSAASDLKATEQQFQATQEKDTFVKAAETKLADYDKRIADGLSPIPRWGEPQDVGRAVSALAGGAFGFSTGDAIHVDGGLHIQRL